MRKLVTFFLLLCLAFCILPHLAFAKTRILFCDNLRSYTQTSTRQKHNLSAASEPEKLSFIFSSSYSNTAGIIFNTKYEVVSFNVHAMVEASTEITCRTISEKLVQPIKIYLLNKNNYLITKPDPADERLKP